MDTKTRLGKRIISGLITEENRKKLSGYLKDRSRTKMIRNICSPKDSHLQNLFRICLKHIAPITAPLALISHIPHSGGLLMNRLFDGHPDIHAHPHAPRTGYPENRLWPKIDLGHQPERWFDILDEVIVSEKTGPGFKKSEKHNGTLPFMFIPYLQKLIFFKYLESVEPIKQRDVFDAYVTSYFGAWLNYQNNTQPKKFVTAIAPGLTGLKENMEDFFAIYPDGRLISLVRHPQTWFDSASGNEPQVYGDIKWTLNRWQESVEAALWTKKRFEDRVCLIQFEDLTAQTESVMCYLADFLQITYEDVLLKPTFNSIPIQPTNDQDLDEADLKSNSYMDSKTLDEDQRKFIEDMTAEDYQAVLQETVIF